MPTKKRAALKPNRAGSSTAQAADNDDEPTGSRQTDGRSKQESLKKWIKVLLLIVFAVFGASLLQTIVSEDDITEVFARQSETLQLKMSEVPCSEDYDNYKRFPGCTPKKCGRVVTDMVITGEEAEQIRRIAERGLSLGGSDGGASILDLHSGALSMGQKFVNVYKYFGDKLKDVFSETDFHLYRDIKQKIHQVIAETFELDPSRLYLTKPTFFSRMNSTKAKTTHDEYWHPHVDKVTYGSFDYTSLLYLSDYKKDFGGGRFIFLDEGANRTVEPRTGRVSFFSSGSENVHRVEQVYWGTRYAITVSFTCDPVHAIDDPMFP